MKKKRFGSLLLALVMLLTAAFFGTVSAMAEPATITEADAADLDAQLNLIYSNRKDMLQKNGGQTWYYTVADLDHDGNLEFIAASLHPQDRSTNLIIREVDKERKGFTDCKLDKSDDESFPDIMTDSMDTYHDTETDTWYYLCYDNIVISDNEVYTIKTAVNLKDNVMSYEPFAVQHIVLSNGRLNVNYTDTTGGPISPDLFNSSGTSAFVGKDRSNTSFDWMTADDADSLTRLTDSYAVFAGARKLANAFPVPKPGVLQTATEDTGTTPAPTPVPSATPVPAQNTQPTYLMITKNPTNESRKGGSTALFVACANAFDSLTWTMVSPDGGEYSTQSFAYLFSGSQVSGEYSTTLSIGNVVRDMNGWGAYCTFYYKGQTASTSTAYILYNGDSEPARDTTGGVYYGTVTDWSFGSVTVNLDGNRNAVLPWSIVTVDGELYYGAPASVGWSGRTGGEPNYTWCNIEGSHTETTVYGSMSGSAYDDSLGQICVFLQNGDTVYIDKSICNIYGYIYAAGGGCSCTVYYTDSPTQANIYQVDVYGYDQPEDAWNDGSNSAYVPEEEVIIVTDEEADWGGYAGSNYYENEYGSDETYDDNWNWSEYNPEGDEYNRVTCPVCGNHFSMGEPSCPVCGYDGT